MGYGEFAGPKKNQFLAYYLRFFFRLVCSASVVALWQQNYVCREKRGRKFNFVFLHRMKLAIPNFGKTIARKTTYVLQMTNTACGHTYYRKTN